MVHILYALWKSILPAQNWLTIYWNNFKATCVVSAAERRWTNQNCNVCFSSAIGLMCKIHNLWIDTFRCWQNYRSFPCVFVGGIWFQSNHSMWLFWVLELLSLFSPFSTFQSLVKSFKRKNYSTWNKYTLIWFSSLLFPIIYIFIRTMKRGPVERVSSVRFFIRLFLDAWCEWTNLKIIRIFRVGQKIKDIAAHAIQLCLFNSFSHTVLRTLLLIHNDVPLYTHVTWLHFKRCLAIRYKRIFFSLF